MEWLQADLEFSYNGVAGTAYGEGFECTHTTGSSHRHGGGDDDGEVHSSGGGGNTASSGAPSGYTGSGSPGNPFRPRPSQTGGTATQTPHSTRSTRSTRTRRPSSSGAPPGYTGDGTPGNPFRPRPSETGGTATRTPHSSGGSPHRTRSTATTGGTPARAYRPPTATSTEEAQDQAREEAKYRDRLAEAAEKRAEEAALRREHAREDRERAEAEVRRADDAHRERAEADLHRLERAEAEAIERELDALRDRDEAEGDRLGLLSTRELDALRPLGPGVYTGKLGREVVRHTDGSILVYQTARDGSQSLTQIINVDGQVVQVDAAGNRVVLELQYRLTADGRLVLVSTASDATRSVTASQPPPVDPAVLDAIRAQDAINADRWHGQDPHANRRLLDYLGVDTEGLTEEQIDNLARRTTQANNVGIRPTQDMDQIAETLIPDRLDGGYLALSTDPNTGEVRTVKVGRDGERVGYTIGTGRYDTGKERYESWEVYYDWETDSLKRADNVATDWDWQTVAKVPGDVGYGSTPPTEADGESQPTETPPLLALPSEGTSEGTEQQRQAIVDAILAQDQLNAQRWHGHDPEANARLVEYLGLDTTGLSESEINALGTRLSQANNVGIRPTLDMDEITRTMIPDRLDGGFLALSTDPNTGEVKTVKVSRSGTIGVTMGTDRYNVGKERYDTWEAYHDWETDSLKRAENVESDWDWQTVAKVPGDVGYEAPLDEQLTTIPGGATPQVDEPVGQEPTLADQVQDSLHQPQGPVSGPPPPSDELSSLFGDYGYDRPVELEPVVEDPVLPEAGELEAQDGVLGAPSQVKLDALTTIAAHDAANADQWHGGNAEANAALLDYLKVNTEGLSEEQLAALGSRATKVNTVGVRPTLNMEEISETLIPDRLDGGFLALSTDPNTGEVKTVKVSRSGTVGYTIGTDRYDVGKERYDTQPVFYDWETDSLKRAANVETDQEFTTVTETEIPLTLTQPASEVDPASDGSPRDSLAVADVATESGADSLAAADTAYRSVFQEGATASEVQAELQSLVDSGQYDDLTIVDQKTGEESTYSNFLSDELARVRSEEVAAKTTWLENQGIVDTDDMSDDDILRAARGYEAWRASQSDQASRWTTGAGSASDRLIDQYQQLAGAGDLAGLNALANSNEAQNTMVTLESGEQVPLSEVIRGAASNIRGSSRQTVVQQADALESLGIATDEMTNDEIDAEYQQKVVTPYESEVLRLTRLGVVSDDDTDEEVAAKLETYRAGQANLFERRQDYASSQYNLQVENALKGMGYDDDDLAGFTAEQKESLLQAVTPVLEQNVGRRELQTENTLKGMGYSDDDIAGFTPEQQRSLIGAVSANRSTDC